MPLITFLRITNNISFYASYEIAESVYSQLTGKHCFATFLMMKYVRDVIFIGLA